MHKWINFDINKAKTDFNKIFKVFPCKDHTLNGVLEYYWIFNKNITKINDSVRYFWPFINEVSNVCLILERELIIIDKTRAYNNKIINDKEGVFDKNKKAESYIKSINTTLFYNKCESIVLKISALFDNCFKSKTINERINFETYLNDFKKIGSNINIASNIETFNNFFIKPLDEYVLKNMRNFFNLYKHNIKGNELINTKLEFQEIFDIWYILEHFIRPILLVLFRVPSKNRNEYFLIRKIDFSFPIEDIYASIINGTKTHN